MGSDVLVALLETVVLGDVVEVILSDNDSTVHLNGLKPVSKISERLRTATTPFTILPRMETLEVKGHFLSMYFPSIAVLGVLKPKPISL